MSFQIKQFLKTTATHTPLTSLAVQPSTHARTRLASHTHIAYFRVQSLAVVSCNSCPKIRASDQGASAAYPILDVEFPDVRRDNALQVGLPHDAIVNYPQHYRPVETVELLYSIDGAHPG